MLPLPPDSIRIPQDPPIWATVVYDRGPQFKSHNTLGHAKLALRSATGRNGIPFSAMWVYRLVEGKWLPWFYFPGNKSVQEHPLFSIVKHKGLVDTIDSDYHVTIEESPLP